MALTIAAARANCAERLKMITAEARMKRIAFNDQLRKDVAEQRAKVRQECAEQIRALKAAEKERSEKKSRPRRPAARYIDPNRSDNGNRPSHASPRRPSPFEEALGEAFAQRDPEGGGLVSIYELRGALDGYRRRDFDKLLSALIRDDKYRPATIETALPADIRKAGIHYRGKKYTFLARPTEGTT